MIVVIVALDGHIAKQNQAECYQDSNWWMSQFSVSVILYSVCSIHNCSWTRSNIGKQWPPAHCHSLPASRQVAAASRYYHSLATHDRAWRMCYWWPLGGNVWQSWPMCDLCLPCTHSLTCLSFVQHKTWYLELRYLEIVIVNCKNICKLIDVILLFDICSIVHLTLN